LGLQGSPFNHFGFCANLRRLYGRRLNKKLLDARQLFMPATVIVKEITGENQVQKEEKKEALQVPSKIKNKKYRK